MSLHTIEKRPAPQAHANEGAASVDALFSIGFRPFFLLAAAFAVVSILLWALVLRGTVEISSRLGVIGWHAHEMLFGFTAAVIAGFLLTAVQNWTNRKTADGVPLMALTLLFVTGRVLTVMSARLPPGLAELTDALFLPALAVTVALPIARAKNTRNAGVPVLLVVWSVANVGMHLAALGIAPALARPALTLALFVPLVFLVFIGGRVIPLFTGNALPVTEVKIRGRNVFDTLAVALVVVAALGELLASFAPRFVVEAGALDVVLGLVVLVRMRGWRAFETWRVPLLWILHVGYALLGLGFIVLGVARASPALTGTTLLAPSTAMHVLTVGALSVLIFGMTTRVGLGHTGRPLIVPKSIVVGYALIVSVVVPRVLLPTFAPAWSGVFFDAAALLFAAAFAIAFVVYLPILTRPRPS
jgi:uncharacterized protein involved in response to NO